MAFTLKTSLVRVATDSYRRHDADKACFTGSYGRDPAYMQWLVHAMRARGLHEMLFTCDNAGGLENGMVDGALQVGASAQTWLHSALAALERLTIAG